MFSLKDIELISRRFDTAADFVHFVEFRTDVRSLTSFLVNDEHQNLLQMIQFAPAIYAIRMHPISDEVLARTVESFRQKASGELLSSPEWRYGLVVDGMIARAHDLDPNLAWNRESISDPAEVARFLGWMSRDRRIKIGKRMLSKCVLSESTGEPQYFSHFQKSRGTVAVYLASGEPREERLKWLEFLVTYAHFKYGAKQAFGVSTDAGVRGRSYDYMLTRKQLQPENIEYLKTLTDPFDDSNEQL